MICQRCKNDSLTLAYNFLAEYVENLPENKWYTEHCGEEIQILRKPIDIKKVETPHFDIQWFDEFGNESSNVDNTYNSDDYDFYRVVYDYIDLFNEGVESKYKPDINYGSLESERKVEYIYTDKYIEHDIYKTLKRESPRF